MTTVGVRELKSHLSDYLARAKAGEVIIVTDRGTKVAQLSPVPETAEERLKELARLGLVDWGGQPLSPFTPLEGLEPGSSLSDLIIAERDEGAARFDRPE